MKISHASAKDEIHHWIFVNLQRQISPNMKRVFFLATLWLCMVGQLSAQQKINVYEQENIPKSASEQGLYGPVKSVKYTDFSLKGDSVYHEFGSTLKFNRIGQLIEARWAGITKDTIIQYYTYDSLNRFESRYSSDGTFSERAVYDSLGRFSHSVQTRRNEKPDSCYRYCYDHEGHCIRYERFIDPNEPDVYKILEHPFLYDSVGHCIGEAEILDEDTSYIVQCQYDANGRVIEYLRRDFVFDFFTGEFTGEEETERELYEYNEGGEITKKQLFYDGELSRTRYYEYDAQNKMQKGMECDSNGNIIMTFNSLYDHFGNFIESTSERWGLGKKNGYSTRLIYEIEYWK